jgi:dipicolinate synthase subunit B
MFSPQSIIYELASPPYGISGDTGKLNYKILPKLPGRFFPAEATKIIMDFKVRNYEIFSQDEEFVRENNYLTALAMQKILNPDPLPTIVLCITGSSCCFSKLLPAVTEIVKDFNVIPVLSQNAALPNRFGDIEKFKTDLRELCKNNIITTIAGAEAMSANKSIVASVVLPATGNTLAKLANAVTDTPVTMAAKALLRNGKPCIVGISTNDALSGNAANLGMLLNRKNYYFVPFGQDDHVNKPYSMVCDFTKAPDAIKLALNGKQMQPIVQCPVVK